MVSELGMLALNTHTHPFPCLPRQLLAGKPHSCSMFLNGSGWEALQGMYKPMAGSQEWVGVCWTTHSPWYVAGAETPTPLLHPTAPLGSHAAQEESLRETVCAIYGCF